MKRGTPRHPKIRRLAKALDIPRYAAIGLLEGLLHLTAEQTPDGAIGRLEDDHIAEELHWLGGGEPLIFALRDSGWLDPYREHRYVLHDWSEHAEDAVNLRLAREGRFFADGTRPKTSRLKKDEREEVDRRLDETEHALAVRTDGAQEARAERTALPSPA